MIIRILPLLLMFMIMACSSEKTKFSQSEITEDEFVPPKNPFSVKGPDSVGADTLKTVLKGQKPGMKPAKIEFEKNNYFFDSLEAKSFQCNLVFKNIGERPLEISKVISCSNAKIIWPNVLMVKEEKGNIRYLNDFTNKSGNFTDTLRIYSNAEDAEMKILIKVKIIGAKIRY